MLMADFTIYFILLLGAGIANSSAVFWARVFPNLNYPLDLNVMIRNRRIFGKNKTFRGLILGSVTGSLFLLFYSLYIHQIPILIVLVIPFLSMLADLVKSFIKRQFNIKEGETFFPFDQIDWILGVMFGLYIFGYTNIAFYFYLLLIGFILHLLAKVLSYIFKFEKRYI
jgi:CDP-2,3-bis-(O-geranylgeranyl)-sn-glycerol synthase